MYLTCPICQSPLSLKVRSYKCENNHSYDLAKEGYVNLLTVQNKNSKNPGDNKEMINARRAFLECGYYDPLVKSITSLIDDKSENILLDSGCGEGYYSAYIAKTLKHLTVVGFDISKEAVKKAAKKNKNHLYFVGSVNFIPIIDKSIGTLLTIFAPIEAEQFTKVLDDKGELIIVSAGKNHMKEIATEIYDTYHPHHYNPLNKLKDQFEEKSNRQLTFQLQLRSEEDMKALLMMTPYYWSATQSDLSKLVSNYSHEITCDFVIQSFIKKTNH